MSGEEQKEAQKFYKNLRLKGSKHQFKNTLGIQIKCFGIAFPNGQRRTARKGHNSWTC